jgi:LmbE family N-acetylglucosaminyl deacetylase
MQRVLMLVAHPDDEALFGFHDLYYNNVTVICFTCGSNPKRRAEFECSARTLKFQGHMLNYIESQGGPNRIDSWKNITDATFYQNEVRPLIGDNHYDIVVSHDADGEYHNIQHIRVHEIAQHTAKALNISFASFRERWDLNYTKELIETKQRLLPAIYPSQSSAINYYMNFYEPK